MVEPIVPATGDAGVGTDRLVIAPGAEWRAHGDEVVILDVEAGMYFALDGTGAFLWRRLDDGATEAELAEALCEAWTVEAPRASADVAAFVTDLRTRGLVVPAPSA